MNPVGRRDLLMGRLGRELAATRPDRLATVNELRHPAPAPYGPWRFASRPDLLPAVTTVTTAASYRAAAGNYIFLAPRRTPGLNGPLRDAQVGLTILDSTGALIWFSPLRFNENAFCFRPQTYQGRPMLTVAAGGQYLGRGEVFYKAFDQRYRRQLNVQAPSDVVGDLHEFLITPADTALVTAAKLIPADLRSVGGPRRGVLLDSLVVEFDPISLRTLFKWSAFRNGKVPLTDSYLPPVSGQPYDYFHINSIDQWPGASNDLVVSARNTSTVYRVSRHDGGVKWRLGGKRSHFSMGAGARFWYQHDARVLDGGTRLSIFDNGGGPFVEPQSRGLILNLGARHVSRSQQFRHTTAALRANGQGNVQLLPNGNVFVGWGQASYFSQFTAAAVSEPPMELDGQLLPHTQSYRALVYPWVGYPLLTELAIATRPNPASSTSWLVFASWNGATQIRSWAVQGGASAATMVTLGVYPRVGFETCMPANGLDPGSWLAVQALGDDGEPRGTSVPVQVG